jgi:hypothetical protein
MTGQKRRGRQISAESLEEKISKAQDKLVATKKAYDEAAQELRNLLEKRDAIRKDELYNKLINSKWTFEQVFKLIEADPPDDD